MVLVLIQSTLSVLSILLKLLLNSLCHPFLEVDDEFYHALLIGLLYSFELTGSFVNQLLELTLDVVYLIDELAIFRTKLLSKLVD